MPHLVNIQFARRTAVTHVSLYMDFKEDDSYTPSKVRILAGTHFHDLVEVRTREMKEPLGWKHFILDKFDDGNESDEHDEGDSSDSDADSRSSSFDKGRHTVRPAEAGSASKDEKAYVPYGVSKRHAPIHAFLVQICILSNHAAGKDTHIRGIHVFGPPTAASREKARRELRKQREAQPVSGNNTLDGQREEQWRRKAALFRWAMGEDDPADEQSRTRSLSDGSDLHIPTSQRLNLMSSLR